MEILAIVAITILSISNVCAKKAVIEEESEESKKIKLEVFKASLRKRGY